MNDNPTKHTDKAPAYRMTRQRRIILSALRTCDDHPAAEEIHHRVRERLPKISLGTVYRNLEILVLQGKIRKLELSGAVSRFDGHVEKHYHIRCLKCGRVDNAQIQPMDRGLEDKLSGATVFTIVGHRLEFTGFCPDCAKEGPPGAFVTD